MIQCYVLFVFFFNDTATTEIYTLSLHDALPICWPWRPSPLWRFWAPSGRAQQSRRRWRAASNRRKAQRGGEAHMSKTLRSEEHTSELQSRQYLVCRLLLEKKNNRTSELNNIRIT